jgi:hypothetical protein
MRLNIPIIPLNQKSLKNRRCQTTGLKSKVLTLVKKVNQSYKSEISNN